jgi:hypothetical protein
VNRPSPERQRSVQLHTVTRRVRRRRYPPDCPDSP